ncbi:MAG: hypothetical protein KDE56_17545, partial [Anaerolineales bacterium]|nr:hypothetical protein [Anaerolineales bacterium]
MRWAINGLILCRNRQVEVDAALQFKRAPVAGRANGAADAALVGGFASGIIPGVYGIRAGKQGDGGGIAAIVSEAGI